MFLKTSNEKKISRTKKKISDLYTDFDQESEIEMSAWKQVKEAQEAMKSASSKKTFNSNTYRIQKGNEQRLLSAQMKGRLARHITRLQGRLDKYENRLKKVQEKGKEKQKEKIQKDGDELSHKRRTRTVVVQGK
jgi:hypothetical protein